MTCNCNPCVLAKYPKYIGIICDNYQIEIKALYAEVMYSATSPNRPAPLYKAAGESVWDGIVVTDFSEVRYADRIIDLF